MLSPVRFFSSRPNDRPVSRAISAYKRFAQLSSRKAPMRPLDVVKSLLPSRFSKKWSVALRELLPLADFTAGNKIKVIRDGDDGYEQMWLSIRNAKERVWMETYIFDEDRVGKKMVEELSSAAKRGCETILMYDYWGSKSLRDSFVKPIRDAGGVVIPFNPMWPLWKRPGPFLFRNHRKVLLVDNTNAFCGGMNVSEEYAGLKYGIGRFRDIVLKIEGKCLTDIEDMIISSIHETDRDLSEKLAMKYQLTRSKTSSDVVIPQVPVPLVKSKKAEILSFNETSPLHAENTVPERIDDVLIQVLQSNVRRQKRQIQRSLSTTMKHSLKNIYICTPYFIPTSSLISNIISAARRGVDVRILTAGSSDVPMSRMASQHIYSRFLRAGIKVYEMEKPVLHAKIITIDGVYSSVGSFNIDLLSQWYNLELNITMVSSKVAHELEKQFISDLSGHVKKVTVSSLNERSIFSRFLHWLAYKGTRLVYLVGGFPPLRRIE